MVVATTAHCYTRIIKNGAYFKANANRCTKGVFKMKKFGINFKLVLISQIISLIGGNILRFALLLFILDLTQSAGILGMVTAISQIPVMLFSIPGGIIADRLNKKKMIVFFDGIKTLICAGLLAIFLTGTYSVTNLTLFIAIFMIIVTLFGPILTAATPSIVEPDHLIEANGAIQGINAVSELLSFVIGGVLVALIGVVNIVILAAIAFLLSTMIDLFIKIPYEKQIVETGVIQTIRNDMKESLAYSIKENPFIIKSGMVFSIISFMFVPILAVALPYIVRIEFQASDALFGVSQAVVVLGMLVGAMLSGKLKAYLKIEFISKWLLLMGILSFLLAASVYAPFFAGSTLIPFWIFNVTLMLIMVIITFGNITVMSLVQEQVPGHLLGKVLALVITIANLVTPIGQYLFGVLMGIVSMTSLLFIAIALLTMGVAMVAKKTFETNLAR